MQNHETDPKVDEYDQARATVLPKKLPADLNLMIYEELWSFISTETIKEHWMTGGKYKCVKYGDPNFEPSFWLNDLWSWAEVTSHPNNLAKSAYTGEKRERARKKSVPAEIERQDEIIFNANESNEEEGDDDNGNMEMEMEVDQDAVFEPLDEAERVEEPATNLRADVTMSHEASSSGISNISRILANNGIDLNNVSNVHISQSFATSTLCANQPRRFSVRQAAKLAKLQSVSPLPDDVLPFPSQSSVEPHPSSPPRAANQATRPSTSFFPRRKPTGNGCGKFRSPLNVNVGKQFASDDDIEMHITVTQSG